MHAGTDMRVPSLALISYDHARHFGTISETIPGTNVFAHTRVQVALSLCHLISGAEARSLLWCPRLSAFFYAKCEHVIYISIGWLHC